MLTESLWSSHDFAPCGIHFCLDHGAIMKVPTFRPILLAFIVQQRIPTEGPHRAQKIWKNSEQRALLINEATPALHLMSQTKVMFREPAPIDVMIDDGTRLVSNMAAHF